MSGISANSWCGKVYTGGSRALRTVRSRNGGTVSSAAPRAVSAHELTNSMAPMPSNMQWFMAKPRVKPPHLNLVTCAVMGGISRMCLAPGTE
uniref:Uncharacterized protein n=1 Tax=Arundo donax TaxID=35708 RepID=A0A0A9DEJ8_ARUDO